MTEINEIWPSVTGWFKTLTDGFLEDPIFYAAIGLVVAAMMIIGVYILGSIKGRFLAGLALGSMVVMLVMIMQYYTNLFTVIYLGLVGADLGAMLFVIGMGLFLMVVIYNLVVTGGKKAIR